MVLDILSAREKHQGLWYYNDDFITEDFDDG